MSASNGSTRSSATARTGFETGYALHPVQRQAAIATPSRWRDAIVTGVTADGWIELVDLVSDKATVVWNFVDNTDSIPVGEPVSWHEHYGVLAIGRAYISVRTGLS